MTWGDVIGIIIFAPGLLVVLSILLGALGLFDPDPPRPGGGGWW